MTIDLIVLGVVLLTTMVAGLTFYHIGWMRGFHRGRGV